MIDPNEVIIENACYETCPCQHYVTYQNKTRRMFSTEIIKLLKELNKLDDKQYKIIVQHLQDEK